MKASTVVDERKKLKEQCKLNERIFAEEVSIDGNVGRASLAAGWETQQGGYHALSRPHVAMYVEFLMNEAGERRGIDAMRVRHEMACIAFANPLDFSTITREGTLELDLSALTRDQAASISEVKTKSLGNGVIEQTIKLHPKQPALHDLAKMCGLFPSEKLELGPPGSFKGDMENDSAMKMIENLKGQTS